MTPQQILALTPGPELDKAVSIYCFNSPAGKRPAYSTDDAAGMKLLDRFPLFVARVDDGHPARDPSRPFVAGTLAHEPSIRGDVTTLRVSAPTRMTALCKAALLFSLRPSQPQRGAKSSADQAREVAARIGTPAARRPGGAPKKLQAPRVPQPSLFTTGARTREKMPTRPKAFVGPTPLPAPGGKS